MDDSTGGQQSVTVWITSLKAGDGEAAREPWQRYLTGLVWLARERLRAAPRAVADEEDAALSAFDGFCLGAARGRYPRLDDRDDLWRLLVVITERKAIDQAQRERRQKRGGGKLVWMSDSPGAAPGAAGLACPEPPLEFAALAADECRRLLGRLRDDSLRQVAQLRMEEYTNEEVVDRLGRSPRSVARKLELIQRTWLGEEGAGP
jgi:DNA-directed RNA polymerase specialized sigma24 family protein